jgi:mono/diheme cytochrome c family protein
MRTFVAAAVLFAAACGGSEAEKPADHHDEKPAEKPAEEPAPPPAPVEEAKSEKDTDISGMSGEEVKAFMMSYGEKVYKTGEGGIACTTCHGAEGKGTPGAFPPLVGQKDHMGDCAKHAGIVINGLTGEIVVDGTTYNGVMTPQGAMLNDLQIAAVINYERNSWGNDYGWCKPEDVAAAR